MRLFVKPVVRALAIAFVLTGCQCSQGVCTATGAPIVAAIFGTTGEEVKAEVVLPITCGTRVPKMVTASVRDGNLDPVDFTAADPTVVPELSMSSVVTFTPVKPGLHSVVVRFEPNFGTAQLNVFVAAEMRDAGSVVLPTRCRRGDLMPSGAAICETMAGTDVFLDGGVLHFNAMVARGGNTLWVSDGGTVERWVDGALQDSASAPHIFIRSPTETEAVLERVGGQLMFYADGGISAPYSITNSAGLVWKDGNRVVTLTSSGGAMSWCVTPLATETKTCSMTSFQFTNKAFGVTPDGIWAEEETMSGFFTQVLDAQNSIGLTLPAGWLTGPSVPNVPWDTGMFISNDAGVTFVLRKVDDLLQLENYGPVRNITSTCVNVDEGTGSRLIRR